MWKDILLSPILFSDLIVDTRIFQTLSNVSAIDVALPLPTAVPDCTALLLQNDFAFSYGRPAVTPFVFDSFCNTKPWKSVFLTLTTTCEPSVQYDRIAAIWIGGLEVLRTSTQEPSSKKQIAYKVKKDISNYINFLNTLNNASIVMALDNVVNNVYTGIFKVKISLDVFYKETFSSTPIPSLIIPLSTSTSSYAWAIVDSKTPFTTTVKNIPKNIQSAQIEIYLSHHQSDEFWYLDLSDTGPFRELIVQIDNVIAGVTCPFPLIFTGGITPYLWRPIVAIGALDAPTYKFDLSAFAGLLADGKEHNISIGILNGLDFWPITANLQFWLDNENPDFQTKGEITKVIAPESLTKLTRIGNITASGSLDTVASRSLLIEGYTTTSKGTFGYTLDYAYSFHNFQTYKNNLYYQTVDQKVDGKTMFSKRQIGSVINSSNEDMKSIVEFHYPISCLIEFEERENPKYLSINSTLYHAVIHKRQDWSGLGSSNGLSSSLKLSNVQNGTAFLLRTPDIRTGNGQTEQEFSFAGGGRCFYRKLSAKNSELVFDDERSVC